MKKRIALCVSCLLLCLCSAMAAVNIIPKPMSVEEKEGEFVFTKGFTIGYSDASLQPAAIYLQEVLEKQTGFNFKTKLGKGKVQLSLVLPDENDESYELVSDKKGVLITAHSYRGIINGIATLRQLMPIKCRRNLCLFGGFHEFYWGIPSVTIKDAPNFHWRGLMLDPVRHFFSVEETKRLLDQMALYKLNKFHWHLSDNEVVLCPFTFLYFDYAQDDNTLRHIYDGDIVPVDLTAEQLKLIKGMQANIWCERIPTEARMQWMVFPRALALAEKAWTPRKDQSWDDFFPRLQAHLKRLDAMGIQYRPLQTKRP